MTKLSPQKAKAVEIIRKHGHLERYDGGYWAAPGLPFIKPGVTPHVGTPTVQALYDAQLLDIQCKNGSWTWDGKSPPRFAFPNQKLVKLWVKLAEAGLAEDATDAP